MNQQKERGTEEKQKKLAINLLYSGSFVIIFLGFFFSAYSVLNGINLKVLNISVPGVAFGLLVVYFGLKNYFKVSDFKTELQKSNQGFHWNNIRRKKQMKFNNILK